jgi:hypothetical protein
MGTVDNLYKLNEVRKGVKNFPKSKWGFLASLLAGTKYGGKIGKVMEVYAKIRLIFFLLSVAAVLFLLIVFFGFIYLLSRLVS